MQAAVVCTMTESASVKMDEKERDALLGTGGTGVLSFGTDDGAAPHAIPVSYGYDPEEGVFYFRLATGADSAKSEPADRPVTFVVYGTDEGDWHSVVATGRLESADEEGVATESLSGLERVHIPLFDTFEQPVRAVTFEFFRLVPDELTGRRESRTGD